MSVQHKPHAGSPFSSFEEFKGSMHSRIAQQIASQALSRPSIKTERVVQEFIQESPPLQTIQDQIKSSNIRPFRSLYRARNETKFSEKLQLIFPDQQEKIFEVIAPEVLAISILTQADTHKLVHEVDKFKKIDRQIGKVLSMNRSYEKFDNKTPIRLIKPENIPQTLRYYLTASGTESFFIFNGKKSSLPSLTHLESDIDKTRALCKWLIGKIERRMPTIQKKKSRDHQIDTLFKNWNLETVREQIHKDLKQHGTTPKTLKRALRATQPQARIHSIPKSVDMDQDPELVAEEAYQQLQKRIISTDCNEDIPSFHILQYFTFNAFAGATLALREIFPAQKHGQLRGSPTKYHFQLSHADFSVTHIKQFIFFNEGGEEDPIASVEVHWTLQAKYGKETHPMGLLSFENFAFHKEDLETREVFYNKISSASRKGSHSPGIIRKPLMRKESKNVLV